MGIPTDLSDAIAVNALLLPSANTSSSNKVENKNEILDDKGWSNSWGDSWN